MTNYCAWNEPEVPGVAESVVAGPRPIRWVWPVVGVALAALADRLRPVQ